MANIEFRNCHCALCIFTGAQLHFETPIQFYIDMMHAALNLSCHSSERPTSEIVRSEELKTQGCEHESREHPEFLVIWACSACPRSRTRELTFDEEYALDI
jgi:hypothetical protein